jgi:hypothetical protein
MSLVVSHSFIYRVRYSERHVEQPIDLKFRGFTLNPAKNIRIHLIYLEFQKSEASHHIMRSYIHMLIICSSR